MRRWQSYYEVFFFPLVLLFSACVIRGISGLILNTTFQTFLHITNKYVILFAEMFNYLGYYLTGFFPFLVLIKLLAKHFDDSSPVLIGVASYVFFHVATMFFASPTFPATSYQTELGISIDATNLTLSGTGMRYPLATGFIGVFIIYEITKYFYTSTRRSSNLGAFAFINRDARALIGTCIAALVCGIGVSFVWKYLVKMLYMIFDFIASDISNPVNLFVYGVTERIMAIFDLDNIIHNVFWFTERGGSWVSNGITYLGDVAVWTAQTAQGINNTGFGRFITPFYIQNLFIIPAIILVTFSTFTDKFERNKFIIFLFVSIITSVLCGNILPFEIYMLIMTPLYYVFHVFMTGILYAVLQASHIWVGYSYAGSLNMATPGNIFDLFVRVHEGSMGTTVLQLCFVGLLFAILYAMILYYYYYSGSIDFLQTGKEKELVDNFITSVGGIENITNIYSTPTKVILQVDDASLLNFRLMQEQGAYKVVETRTTYDISFGSMSCLLVKDVNMQRKKKPIANQKKTNTN